jgi:hypothetical protein
VPLPGGTFFFVSLEAGHTFLAGDFNDFAPEAMTADVDANGRPFAYLTRTAADGDRYKFASAATNADFVADVSSRVYAFDDFGEISFVNERSVDRTGAYRRLYARHFALVPVDGGLLPRNVRVLLPSTTATRVLYVHDGQNVFARDSSIPTGFDIPDGGWQLDGVGSAPDDTMVVAIDNTAQRFSDYTHVVDDLTGAGDVTGGRGDAYADFVVDVVRPLVDRFYGEPPVQGVMGSSLGGLISLAIVDRHPSAFEFAACLSSTFGWGSLSNRALDDGDDTLFDRVRGRGFSGTVVYLDSGGGDGANNDGAACVDGDGDGVEDEVLAIDAGRGAADNFCETVQMRDVLDDEGWTPDRDLFWHWDPGLSGNGDAAHTESAWAYRARNRVFPLFSTVQAR